MNLRTINSIKDMPVLDLETGAVLGRVVNWAVHPKEQRVAAFLLGKILPIHAWPVIIPADIVEYAPRMIVARNREVIIRPQEVVGLPELIDQRINLISFQAVAESGKPLGKVVDFTFDTLTSQIYSYDVAPRTTNLLSDTLILPANRVVKIMGRKIIFTDDAHLARIPLTDKQTQTA